MMLSFTDLSEKQKYVTINPVAFNSVGEYTLRIVMSDNMLESEYFMKVKVINTLPKFFKDYPKNQEVHLNEVLSYLLPVIFDAEGHTIIVDCISKPDFVYIENDMFIFMPTSVTNLGTHTLDCFLTDGVKVDEKTPFKFKVSVINSSPYFEEKPRDQRAVVGITS
jgi:hypothetical protein